MYGIYHFCKSYGLSLIIFAILTKALLLPLNIKSQQSSAKMRALNPKLEKIRKSFANNPQRMQEEQMKLQAEEGVSLTSGCLPALIQFPILFGIVDVVYNPLTHILRIGKDTLETAAKLMENIPGITKTELSSNYRELTLLKYVSDPEYRSYFADMGSDFISKISDFNANNMFLGFINLGTKADLHPEKWTAGAVALVMIPVLSGLVNLATTIISQIHQKKTNPAAASMGSMNLMLYGMSIFYIWFSFTIPSGAAFYWTVSGILGLIQMIAFNKYYTAERCEAILAADKEKNKNKKPGLMQRLMEQQQEMLAQQNGQGGIANRGDLSRSEYNEVNRKAINHGRQVIDAKYTDLGDDDDDVLSAARKRMAQKYGDIAEEND
jgi:YidC/Oxa1 family membrane protein insertase